MKRKASKVIISLALMMTLGLMALSSAQGADTEDDFDLAPGDFEGMPIPMTPDGSFDIEITSDIPVTLYIMTQTDYMNAGISGEITVHEQKFEDVTSKVVSYDYGSSPPQLMWVVVENTDDADTANVHVRVSLTDELIDTGTEAAKDAICGSSILLLVGIAAAAVIVLSYLRKR